MGPEGIILVNPPITTFQQSLTHSAVNRSQSHSISVAAGIQITIGSYHDIVSKY